MRLSEVVTREFGLFHRKGHINRFEIFFLKFKIEKHFGLDACDIAYRIILPYLQV